MRVLIVGAGLIGVTSAYLLSRRGHEVTVVERHAEAAQEASYANGALLTPGMPHPWNSPGCWRELLASLMSSKSALKVHWRTLPSLSRWGLDFLRNSRSDLFEAHALANLRLSLHSLARMQDIVAETGIDYQRRATGSLRIFRDSTSLARALEVAAGLSRDGLLYRELTAEATIALEPALDPIKGSLEGAIHYLNDEIGDARLFCRELQAYTQGRGVRYKFGTEIIALQQTAKTIRVVSNPVEMETYDACVVAAGSFTRPLLRSTGLQVPVRPVKGYSVTFQQGPNPVGMPIVDDHYHAAVVPVGDSLRVAGTAEFAGFDTSIPNARVSYLSGLVANVLPRMSLQDGKAWSGLRSVSSDGVPLIGSTRLPKIFLNTGQGHLGWTMAAGSSQLLTELLSGDRASIDATPYSPTRFD